MKLEKNIDTTADLAASWVAITDIAHWPRWTPSVTSVELLDEGPLRLGSRARVKQPGMQRLIWSVTALKDREEFTWATHSPGIRTIGRHLIRRNADGSTRIRLELEQTGALAGLLNLFIGRRTARYLDLEATGLKAASEDVAARG